jgi:hypothetical protein
VRNRRTASGRQVKLFCKTYKAGRIGNKKRASRDAKTESGHTWILTWQNLDASTGLDIDLRQSGVREAIAATRKISTEHRNQSDHYRE